MLARVANSEEPAAGKMFSTPHCRCATLATIGQNRGARFEVHFAKTRGVHGDKAKPFEAQFEVRDGAALWTVREIEDVNLARVKAGLDDGLTVREIADRASQDPPLAASKSSWDRIRQPCPAPLSHGLSHFALKKS